MRLLSCSRMSCGVNWNCRDYINGINELWLPDASALIKTAWWAKWTQADKRTGSIWWAYRLLMRKTLLPSFSTDMSLERSDCWGSSGERGCKRAGAPTCGRKRTTHCGGQECAEDTFLFRYISSDLQHVEFIIILSRSLFI